MKASGYTVQASPILIGHLKVIALMTGERVVLLWPGSGGAVVAVVRSEDERPDLEAAYAGAGYKTLRPTVAPETGTLT